MINKQILYFFLLFILYILLNNNYMQTYLRNNVLTISCISKELYLGITAFIFVILAFVLYNFITEYKEGFHFEVSPGRKNCLFQKQRMCPASGASPYCCGAGFHGKPIGFRYTPDCQLGQSCPKGCPPKKECKPDVNYTTLGDYKKLESVY